MVHLLRRDHVDVRVDAAGGGDEVLAGDYLGTRSDDHFGMDAVHDAGIAGLANRDDEAVAHPDVGLDDAQDWVHDDGVGDDQVQRTVAVAYFRGLSHAVAGGLTATEHQLVPVSEQVLLDLADQGCIGQAEPVSDRRAVQVHVLPAADSGHVVMPRWFLLGSAAGQGNPAWRLTPRPGRARRGNRGCRR